MRKLWLFIYFVCIFSIFAECIQEDYLTGRELNLIKDKKSYHVLVNDSFHKLGSVSLKENHTYLVQINSEAHLPHHKFYAKEFLQYYDLNVYNQFLNKIKPQLEKYNYELIQIGQSIQNNPLYAILPKEISTDKKTILMTGRQHGDEGTANYLIEGFLQVMLQDQNLTWLDHYQLILYPMINPDGVQARTRYNANGLDLNRHWSLDSRDEKDEIIIIHEHLRSLWKKIGQSTFIVLDMHGSIREDFIFRVKRSFRGRAFFRKQSLFINRLGNLDKWQNGRAKLSNGDRQMARIVFIRDYKKNALTHETIKNIPANNNQGRSLKTLRKQGEDLFVTLKKYY